MDVLAIDVPHLGNRTYLIHDGVAGLVIDPPRDARAVEEAAEAAGVPILAVADTHVHSDFLSGGLALAVRHGADYLLSAAESVRFDRTGVRDGDVLWFGGLELTVLDTPGHTEHHQAFLVRDGDGAAVFSGGSLLHGTVGRTDLVRPELTLLLARAQWESGRRVGALPGATRLHPTHGFGSLCAATPVDDTEHLVVADERGANPVLLREQDPFVEELVRGFGPVPSHFRHLPVLNRAGASARPPRPTGPAVEDDVHAAVRAGRWVVDVRPRHQFARGHLTGTVNIEAGPLLATYAGWLLPWGEPIVLVGDDEAVIDTCVDQLGDVGVEVSRRHLLRPVGCWRDSTDYRVVDWAGYARGPERRVTLDVRHEGERAEGHLAGSLHIPLQDLSEQQDRLPAGHEIWVHCRSGFRAAIAASLLARAGRCVVLVTDDWDRAPAVGLDVVRRAA